MSLITQLQEQTKEQVTLSLHERLTSIAIERLEEMMSPDTYDVVDLVGVELTEEELVAEGAGSLSGLPKHILKAVVSRPVGSAAGENSPVSVTKFKAPSAMKTHINDALKDGHVPVVHVNGKPHAAAVPKDRGAYGSREEYQVHDSDKQSTFKETIHPPARRYGGKVHYATPYQVDRSNYTKGDAVSKLMPSHEKDFFKDNEVTVHVIQRDKARLEKVVDRNAKKPEMQTNFVKTKEGDDHKKVYGRGYGDEKTVTSKTPAGNMDVIKKAAALKLAGKKLGDSGSSANKEAMDLHAEVSKHIASGDTRAATRALSALSNHIQNKGLATSDHKKKEYAEELGRLKSSYSKGYAKERLAKLRGESVEELTVAELECIAEEFDNLDDESKEILASYVSEAIKTPLL